MTAPRFVRALVAAAPHPAPVPRPQLRPQLTVVPDPSVVRARRLARLGTAIAGLAVCFGLFGVVIVQAMLAEGQGQVQELRAQVQEQLDRRQRLQLQVGQLEAPDRVVTTAREKLGMVAPSDVVSLGPTGPIARPTTTEPAPSVTTPATNP